MLRPLEKGTRKFKEPKWKARMAVVGQGQNDKERDAGDTVKWGEA